MQNMEEVPLSSDSDRGPSPSPPPSPRQRTRGQKAKSSKMTKSDKSANEAPAVDRDAQRRHNALEKQFLKAQRQTLVQVHRSACDDVEMAPVGQEGVQLAPAPSSAQSAQVPLVSQATVEARSRSSSSASHLSRASRPLPEATFTPTAAGLRPESATASGQPVDFNVLFSQAMSQFFQAGFQQAAGMFPPPLYVPAPACQVQPAPVHCSTEHFDQASVSVRDEEFMDDFEMSEDEESSQEGPAFPGLFKPSLFKSLLRKAKIATNMDTELTQTSVSQAPGPADKLFNLPKPKCDFVPCPDLFSQVIQKPWEQPTSLSGPNALDRTLYSVAPHLDALLQLPTVDEPVASLTSSSILVGEAGDGLKFEDKRAEMAFRKTHQAAAWAIRAATSSSFFNRASLVWLRQLRDKFPPEDTRLQQDLAKLIAAAEYSADASLSAARFASRAMASSVSSRRLLWLRNWRADSKSKWRLTAAPYKGQTLFGDSLDSVLVENRDKKKVLPTSFRRQDRRPSPYQRPPFRQGQGAGGAPYYRHYQPYQSTSDRSAFRDRGSRQSSFRRPFRSASTRYPRRGK